jgi:hypothetical protein
MSLYSRAAALVARTGPNSEPSFQPGPSRL